MKRQIFDTTPRNRRITATCLALSFWALGVTCAYAAPIMVRDASVAVVIGSSYTFRVADFPFEDADGDLLGGLHIESDTEHGTLKNRVVSAFPARPNNISSVIQLDQGHIVYTPSTAAISVTNSYDSFTYRLTVGVGVLTSGPDKQVSDIVTMTINLVSASTQTAAAGAPTITAAAGITASIAGVTDRNGIDVDTLSWQWQQADAPPGGADTPADSAYSDIADAASSDFFAPRAAQVGRYVRACVSFMDQHDTPAQEGLEGSLCSAGHRVTEANLVPEVRLRLRLFLEGPLR